MRKVTTVSLNHIAFSIDEAGYTALQEYLDQAERSLVNNPDRAEVMSDLEQAIADKLSNGLGRHRNVVSHEDVLKALAEMGPVEGGDTAQAQQSSAGSAGIGSASAGTATGNGTAGSGNAAHSGSSRHSVPPRRMYRLEEGAMWAGVCNGLAAFFGIDVVWMRVIFILLTLFTGVWLLVYIALIFIVPKAETAEEYAAARGEPFNAQELIDRFKKKSMRGFRAAHTR